MSVSYRFLLGAIVFSALVMIAPGSHVGVYAYVSDTESGTGAVTTAESFPYLDVTVDDCTVRQNGDRVDVTVSVSNNGSVADTQTTELSVGAESSPRDSTALTVPAESTETVDLGWEPTIDGFYTRFTVTVSSEDASTESALGVVDWGEWGGYSCFVTTSNTNSARGQSSTMRTLDSPDSVDSGAGPAGTASGDRSPGTSPNDATGSVGSANETGDGSNPANATGGGQNPTNTTSGTPDPTNSTVESVDSTNSTGDVSSPSNATAGGPGPDNATDVSTNPDSSTVEANPKNSTENGANSTDPADLEATPVNSTADGSGTAEQFDVSL